MNKKNLVILIGPQGCGKTTFIKNNKEYKTYFRISQDDFGTDEYYNIFLEKIKTQKNIIVDRMNFSIKQREKFVKVGKLNNFKITFILFFEKYSTCYNRILKRINHPNLNFKTDEKIIINALDFFFKNFEFPKKNEYDEIKKIGKDENFILDLSEKFENFFLIGDIHGCYNEFNEMVKIYKKKKKEIEKQKQKLCLILLGDLFDKGQEIKKSFKLYLKLKKEGNCFLLLGNHENTLKNYLIGKENLNKYGIKNSVDEFNLTQNFKKKIEKDLFLEICDLPRIIKLNHNNYCIHGGLNPFLKIEEQNFNLVYRIRTFSLKDFNFSNPKNKYWFEYYDEKNPNIFFGHNYHKKIQVRKNVFSLDGFCVFGKELRAMLLTKKKELEFDKEFFKIKAQKVYKKQNYKYFENENLNKFLDLTKTGFLKKSEDEDIILFNYTKKTIYEKKWNRFTTRARGLIFDKKTKKIVARPFTKFFNLNENEITQKKNLPKKDYEVFEKIDGVMGILFFYKNRFRIETRGELNSIQSKIANKILESKIKKNKINLKSLDKKNTYLFEIVSKKISSVIEAKKNDLILLGAINTEKDIELNYIDLKKISKKTGFSLVKKFDYNIDEILQKDKENKFKNTEGFVIKFKDGFKVKIKTKTFLQNFKILNNIDFISFFNVMKNGKISEKYLQKIPEEFLEKSKKIKEKLEYNYNKILVEIEKDIKKIPKKLITKNNLKEISLFILDKKNEKKIKHKKAIFFYLKNKKMNLDKYIKNTIYPKNNIYK